MKQIKVKLTGEQYNSIYGRVTTDRAKGEAIEEIARQILLQLGADEVYNNTDLEKQIHKGDLMAVRKDKEPLLIEVKTSHTFRLTNKDKLAFDYKYYKKNTNCSEPYNQTTTNTYLGWLYYTQADVLMAFNSDSSKMYIIQQYQKLKYKVFNDIEQYIEKLEQGNKTWFKRGYNNNISPFLEGGIKKDTCKDSLIINLELSKEAIEYYNSKCRIIDVIIEEKDNKKTLDSLPTKSVLQKRI